MSDLKPCPFCGGEAREEEAGDGGKFIECSTCSACTALHYDRAENLVSAWNRRWDAEDTLREMREADARLTKEIERLQTLNAEMAEVLREAEELLRHVPEATRTAFLAGIEEREGGSARRQEKFLVPSETLRRKIPSAIVHICDLLAKAEGAGQ